LEQAKKEQGEEMIINVKFHILLQNALGQRSINSQSCSYAVGKSVFASDSLKRFIGV
jgi:hypothetical protein